MFSFIWLAISVEYIYNDLLSDTAHLDCTKGVLHWLLDFSTIKKKSS